MIASPSRPNGVAVGLLVLALSVVAAAPALAQPGPEGHLTYELGDVTVHYFQVGGLVEKAAPGADLVPFGGFLVGAVCYDIASDRWEDEWKFAATS